MEDGAATQPPASQPPALDHEEMDVSDLEVEEDLTQRTPQPSPQQPPHPQQQLQQQEPMIMHADLPPMPPVPPPPALPLLPIHHMDWFQANHAAHYAAVQAASAMHPPRVRPPPVTPTHFPGLHGLGLTPLYLRRHPHSPEDPNKRHTWTGEEDRRLKELVKTVGPRKWGVIATHFKNRNAKQCHQRWHYVLKPTITREPWTEEEDQAILQYQIQIGNKWSHIAKVLPGRTGYAIRNRYNFLSKRQLEEAQRHLRPYLDPPMSLHMYAAAAAAAAAAGDGNGRSGADVGVQQNGCVEEEEEEAFEDEEEEEGGAGGEEGDTKGPPLLPPPPPLTSHAVPAGWVPPPPPPPTPAAPSTPTPEPPSLAQAFAPYNAKVAGWPSSSLSASESSATYHEQQYQARHGSTSSFDNAVFANLELMATAAAGQLQQVPVHGAPGEEGQAGKEKMAAAVQEV